MFFILGDNSIRHLTYAKLKNYYMHYCIVNTVHATQALEKLPRSNAPWFLILPILDAIAIHLQTEASDKAAEPAET